MTEDDFGNLCKSLKVRNLSFDGEFKIEFEKGITVTVNKNSEWGVPVWEIESNFEETKRRGDQLIIIDKNQIPYFCLQDYLNQQRRS